MDWHFNLSLATWDGRFLERLIRIGKQLFMKQLKTYRLNYERMQSVLQEIEVTVNNQPLS